MKILRYLIVCLFTLFLMSCVSPQKIPRCEVNKIIEGNIQDLQNGYSLKIPSNWIAYKDIHCELTYSPNEWSDKDFGWIHVQLYHNIDKEFYKRYSNIDDFVMSHVKIINKNLGNPRVEILTLQHQRYGEFRILKFDKEIFGNIYTYTKVYYFFESSGYEINYFTEITDYEKYLPDFIKMVESFEIKE